MHIYLYASPSFLTVTYKFPGFVPPYKYPYQQDTNQLEWTEQSDYLVEIYLSPITKVLFSI